MKIESLIPAEARELDRLVRLIELRKENSLLAIVGAQTLSQKTELQEFLLSKPGIERFEANDHPLLELVETKQPSDHTIYLIDLFAKTDEALMSRLQFARDYIAQHQLKVIFLLRNDEYERLKQEAYDFFSTAHFSFAFTDHRYDYQPAEQDLSKLREKIAEYESKKGQLNDRLKMEQLFDIAQTAYKSGMPDEAIAYWNQALKWAQELAHEQAQGTILGNIGLVYRQMGELEKALRYLKEALEIHKKIGYLQGEANQFGNIGLVYRQMGELEKALRYLKEALEIHKKIGYLQGEASDLGNIGLVYRQMGELEKALRYHKEALEIERKLGIEKRISEAQKRIEALNKMESEE